MARSWGRALKGERIVGYVPHGRWQSTTVIGSISLRYRLSGLMAIEGAANGDLFTEYVRHFLVPLLERGDVVIMDNLSVHKVKAVRSLIEEAGAKLLYLPPYHPDLNPIELAWNKVKSYLRKIGARTKETLDAAICKAADLISQSDVVNFFKKCSLKVN